MDKIEISSLVAKSFKDGGHINELRVSRSSLKDGRRGLQVDCVLATRRRCHQRYWENCCPNLTSSVQKVTRSFITPRSPSVRFTLEFILKSGLPAGRRDILALCDLLEFGMLLELGQIIIEPCFTLHLT